MNRKKWWFVSIVMALALVGLAPFAFAQDDAASRATLDGLKAVYVMVDSFGPQIEQEGLTTDQLQSDIGQQLLDAGIKVLPEKEFNRLMQSQNYPLALIRVSAGIIDIKETGAKAYYITFQVQQLVRLIRKPVIKRFATTWEKRGIASGSPAHVRETVQDLVGQFITVYSSVNP